MPKDQKQRSKMSKLANPTVSVGAAKKYMDGQRAEKFSQGNALQERRDKNVLKGISLKRM